MRRHPAGCNTHIVTTHVVIIAVKGLIKFGMERLGWSSFVTLKFEYQNNRSTNFGDVGSEYSPPIDKVYRLPHNRAMMNVFRCIIR